MGIGQRLRYARCSRTEISRSIAKIAMLIANARMYSVNAPSRRRGARCSNGSIARAGCGVRGHRLSGAAAAAGAVGAARHGLRLHVRLSDRDARRRRRILAAPVPAPARYGDTPVYWTDIVVRADAPLRQLADIFGTALRVHDRGFAIGLPGAAPRCSRRTRTDAAAAVRVDRRSADHAAPRHRRGRWPATPMPVRSTAISTTCCAQHEPALAARLRTMASTPPTPIPPLVAAPALPRRRCASGCARRCWRSADADELAPVRAALLLAADSPRSMPADYAPLRDDALRRRRGGYPSASPDVGACD